MGLHQQKGGVLNQRGEGPESTLAGVESQALCSEKGGQGSTGHRRGHLGPRWVLGER